VKRRFHWRLRTTLPALLLLAGVVLSLASLSVYRKVARARVQQGIQERLARIGNSVEGMLERLVCAGDQESIDSVMSSMSTTPHIVVAALMDDRDVVVAALRRVHRGRRGRDAGMGLRKQDWELIDEVAAEVRRTRRGTIRLLAEREALAAVYPVRFGRAVRGPGRIGYVLIVQDTRGFAARINRTVTRQVAAFMAGFGVIGVVLWLFLHFRVARRLHNLGMAVGREASGAKGRPASEDGADEIGDLARGYNDMLRRRAGLEEQLHQSQKMQAIGKLAGGVAHDFNNILAIILANAELLAEGEDAPLAEDIVTSAKRGADLTRQLLAVSRQSVGSGGHCELNAWLRESETLLAGAVSDRIALGIAPADEPAHVSLSAADTNRVLVNLVLNARDAMPDGGPLRITVSVLSGAELPAGVDIDAERISLLRVSDGGPGMPDEVRRRVFEPFFTTKQAGRGDGLGLSIVYGLVRNAGGDIVVRSEVGHGTSFDVYLPCVARVEGRAVDAGAGTAVVGGQLLVVDDNPAVAAAMTKQLRSAGFSVTTATSAHEALAICRSRHGDFDALVSDVSMPEMSGPELVALLRAEGRCPPCLFVSGYTAEYFADSGQDIAAEELLSKPFVSADLIAAIGRVRVDRA